MRPRITDPLTTCRLLTHTVIRDQGDARPLVSGIWRYGRDKLRKFGFSVQRADLKCRRFYKL